METQVKNARRETLVLALINGKTSKGSNETARNLLITRFKIAHFNLVFLLVYPAQTKLQKEHKIKNSGNIICKKRKFC